ncbi:MAG: MATE family efflux transporter [Eubacteriales bacterium]|nr:MATE family efflux transporter [Eubacteriales bacterium]
MLKTKGLSSDFTNGSIPGMLLVFGIPFILSTALQLLYSLIDMLVVGNFVGSYGLSAVSVASQAANFPTMLCMGFSSGAQVLVAQLLGAGKKENIQRCIGTFFSVLFVAAFFLSALLIGGNRLFLKLLNTPQESYQMARDYLIICGGGCIFTFGYNAVAAILRGMGDSRHPLVFIAIASVINLVLDLVFIGGFGWGTAGAALATVLGQAFAFGYALLFLYCRREEFGFDFQPESFRIHSDTLKVLLNLGVPFSISSCAVNISMMFINSMVNSYGVYASAVFGVGVKLDDIVHKLTIAFSNALMPIVAQNLAAGKRKRAQQAVYWTWIYCGICYAIFTVVFCLNSEGLFRLFTDEMRVIELAPMFVSAVIWGFPGMVLMRGTGGFIQGLGHAKLSMVLGLLDGFVIRIFLSYLLGSMLGLGLWGFFFGFSMACYGAAIPGVIYFLSGKWKTRELLVKDG